jgi:chaperonin cofactor prefoldin
LNADAKNPTLAALSSADVQTRIDDERRRLLIEQNLEHDLTGQRIAPLEAGDDAALDRVEAQINQCRDRQFRIQERLEILEKRLTEANERAAGANLDVIADRANRARELGERLIKSEYTKHARALAAVLQKVAAVDALIQQSNLTLSAAGRHEVAASNAIRCTPSQWVEFVERKTVHVNDPRHPLHGLVQSSMSGRSYNRIDTKAPVESTSEVDIEGSELLGGQYPQPLYAEVTLPTIDPMPLYHRTLPQLPSPQPFFTAFDEARFVGDEAVAALIEELDGTAKRKTA